MKMGPLFLLVFLFSPYAFSQEAKRTIDSPPPTPEEKFYSGDQVNPEAFSSDEEGGFERQEEEEISPYSPHEEVYPYENMDAESEEYLEDEY